MPCAPSGTGSRDGQRYLRMASPVVYAMTHNLRRAGILEILVVLDREAPLDADAIADRIALDRDRTEKVLSTLNHTDEVIEHASGGAWRLTERGSAVVERLRESAFDVDAFMDRVREYRRVGEELAAMRDEAFDIAADA